MKLPKLGRILAAESSLQPLLAKARDIRALAALVNAFLPAELARQARVANYRDGEVILVAANSAAASKLRLLAPSLSRFLLNQRWQVISVSVRVQPNASRERIAAPHKVAQFSTLTLDFLKDLYAGMRDSPAREALGRLLERCGATNRSEAPGQRTKAGQTPGRKPRI